MQQHEKDKLEERIVAYFEGELDPNAGKQLLADVAKNTESRALFKSHESLNALINAARVPMEVPLEAKRSIAERIPGLIAFIPGLLGGAQAIPVLTQSGNSLFGFLAKIPLSTAISVGTSVAVLTTAGVIVKNKMDANADAERKAKVVLMQNQSKVSDGTQYSIAPLPTKDVAVPNIGNASATVVGGEGSGVSNNASPNASSTNTSSANTPPASGFTPAVPSQAERTHLPIAPKTLAAVVAGTEHVASAHAAKGVDGMNNSGRSEKPKAIDRSANASIADKSIADNERSKDFDQSENQSKNFGIAATTPTTPASDAPPQISTVGVSQSSVAPANNALPRTSVLSPLPISFGDGLVVRPFGSIGTRISFFNVKGESSADKYRSGTAAPVMNILAGLDFLLDEVWSLRIQGGQSAFAHEVRRSDVQLTGLLPSYVQYSTVESDAAFWSTAGVNYQFSLTDAVPVTLSAGVGAAWLHPIAFMADFGVTAEMPVSSGLALRPGVTFDLLKTGIDALRDGQTQPGSAIIVNRELSGNGFWSTSVGINIGFIARF